LSPQAQQLRLGGRVQGVGFRPFVYRLAQRHRLTGWVRNCGGEVEIWVEGEAPALTLFCHELIHSAPPFARPQLLTDTAQAPHPYGHFEIHPSSPSAEPLIHLPPDQFACDDCLREMRDPSDRRHAYPFINCTQCGPRYTLIAALPYDRAATSMAGFPLCADCAREYADPADRRFHAEPLACPRCGPQLQLHTPAAPQQEGMAALAATVAALRAGEIVAVKGVGGYHLLCDAGNEAAVARLRQRKPRPHKPLAVMFPEAGAERLDRLREELRPDPLEAALLTAPERPIVLVTRRPESRLAAAIAPALNEVGAMLPYSPLHHLLLERFDGPLVATSGNLGGEPVLIDNDEAQLRLAQIADRQLHHNRPILRPADDALYRRNAGQMRPLRLGRGVAPLELPLPQRLPEPLLAVGGQMKNAVALAWGERCVLSPHIGDLASPRGLAVFERVVADLQQLYGVTARRLICDAHPGYSSSRWAARSGLPWSPVYHHRAHAAGLYGEHAGQGDWLIFTWDGVGLGEDGTLWGGEALLGRPGGWRRVATLRPFRLPGGERVGREPWRAALALCWESAHPWPAAPADTALLHQAWARGLNAPQSSAAGRLFDAAAALLGLVNTASFEGQGPMYLEAVASAAAVAPLALPITQQGGLLQLDWAPLLPLLLADTAPLALRAARFHASLAWGAAEIAAQLAARHPISAIGASGGVFQNRLLTEQLATELANRGLSLKLAQAIPCNDGGLAYGQLCEAAATLSAPA